MYTPDEYIERALRTNVVLSSYTTFHIGGPADYFVAVEDVQQLMAAAHWVREKSLPLTILGGGSNMIVSDLGIRGLVAHVVMKGIDVEEHDDEVLLRAGAGEVFDEVVEYAVSREWWGLENLSSIPGYVGATPVQNVGAYGVEMSERIASVEAYDTRSDEVRVFTPEECRFEYRDSFFKSLEGKEYVITHVTYRLSKHARPVLTYRDLASWSATQEGDINIREIRNAVKEIRAQKFPDWRQVGTAGSFFKNPIISAEEYERLRTQYPDIPGHEQKQGGVKVSLGWILDRVLALRGYRIGNVGTYEHQALVVVNHGGATAADVELFARDVQKKVFDATNISIEWEVTMVS